MHEGQQNKTIKKNFFSSSVTLKRKSENVIKSNCYSKNTIFNIFSLTQKEKEVWPDVPHPMLFPESSCFSVPKF